jgi:hypothetical protein
MKNNICKNVYFDIFFDEENKLFLTGLQDNSTSIGIREKNP